MNTTVLIFLVLYYVVVLGIGYWALKRGGSENLEGYLLGGRKIGPATTALTPVCYTHLTLPTTPYV